MNEQLSTATENTMLLDKALEFKRDSMESIPAHINLSEHDVPDIFKNFAYPVSAWPVIINSEIARDLEKISQKIPKMICQLPDLYFGSNVKKIADYYFEGNEAFAEFSLMSHEKDMASACRLDLTLSDKGFNVLEVNISSAIGGWQVQSFESIIRQQHAQLSNAETVGNYHSENTQVNYVKFIVDKIQEHVELDQKEINLFLGLGNVKDELFIKYSLDFFNNLLKKELQKRGLKGQAYSGTYTSLKLLKGKLFFNDKEMHSVLVMNLDGTEMPKEVFRAFIMDNIYYPDHLGLRMYNDKRNLGLLRELAEQKKFSAADNELILKCIPWTAVIEDKMALFNHESIALRELLKTKREDFVIKASRGLQGKNVFIGKYTSQEDWEDVIEKALKEKIFIAQEFCESKNFNVPNKNNEWTPHKFIWGAFGFGEKYGGVWVRMSEIGSNAGVINSATGAVTAIVFETKK